MKHNGKEIVLKGVEVSRIKTLDDACRPCVFYKGNCPRDDGSLICTGKMGDKDYVIKDYHFVYSLSKVLKEL